MVDLSALRTLTLDVNAELQANAVDATVTPPGEAPIVTRVIWLPPSTELTPGGFGFRGAESRYQLAIKRSAVPSVPQGTEIVAADRVTGVIKTWRVDGSADPQADHHRVFVIEDLSA